MLTKNAIGNLLNRYRAVLGKCRLLNVFGSLAVAGLLVAGVPGVAGATLPTGGADVEVTIESGAETVSGAYQAKTVTITGGSLTVNNPSLPLYINTEFLITGGEVKVGTSGIHGALDATGVASGSYTGNLIMSGGQLKINGSDGAGGAQGIVDMSTVALNGGTVTIGKSDSGASWAADSSRLDAKGGALTVAGATVNVGGVGLLEGKTVDITSGRVSLLGGTTSTDGRPSNIDNTAAIVRAYGDGTDGSGVITLNGGSIVVDGSDSGSGDRGKAAVLSAGSMEGTPAAGKIDIKAGSITVNKGILVIAGGLNTGTGGLANAIKDSSGVTVTQDGGTVTVTGALRANNNTRNYTDGRILLAKGANYILNDGGTLRLNGGMFALEENTTSSDAVKQSFVMNGGTLKIENGGVFRGLTGGTNNGNVDWKTGMSVDLLGGEVTIDGKEAVSAKSYVSSLDGGKVTIGGAEGKTITVNLGGTAGAISASSQNYDVPYIAGYSGLDIGAGATINLKENSELIAGGSGLNISGGTISIQGSDVATHVSGSAQLRFSANSGLSDKVNVISGGDITVDASKAGTFLLGLKVNMTGGAIKSDGKLILQTLKTGLGGTWDIDSGSAGIFSHKGGTVSVTADTGALNIKDAKYVLDGGTLNNAGTINVINDNGENNTSGAGYAAATATLQIKSGTFTNTGTIEVGSGAANNTGLLDIQTSIVNDGSINVRSSGSMALAKGTTLTNKGAVTFDVSVNDNNLAGTLKNDATAAEIVVDGTAKTVTANLDNALGSVFVGKKDASGPGKLTLAGESTSAGLIHLTSATSELNFMGGASLVVQAGNESKLTNAGIINVYGQDNGSATLTINTAGDYFANTKTINVGSGAGTKSGVLNINESLENAGKIDVKATGTLTVAANKSLTMTGANGKLIIASTSKQALEGKLVNNVTDPSITNAGIQVTGAGLSAVVENTQGTFEIGSAGTPDVELEDGSTNAAGAKIDLKGGKLTLAGDMVNKGEIAVSGTGLLKVTKTLTLDDSGKINNTVTSSSTQGVHVLPGGVLTGNMATLLNSKNMVGKAFVDGEILLVGQAETLKALTDNKTKLMEGGAGTVAYTEGVKAEALDSVKSENGTVDIKNLSTSGTTVQGVTAGVTDPAATEEKPGTDYTVTGNFGAQTLQANNAADNAAMNIGAGSNVTLLGDGSSLITTEGGKGSIGSVNVGPNSRLNMGSNALTGASKGGAIDAPVDLASGASLNAAGGASYTVKEVTGTGSIGGSGTDTRLTIQEQLGDEKVAPKAVAAAGGATVTTGEGKDLYANAVTASDGGTVTAGAGGSINTTNLSADNGTVKTTAAGEGTGSITASSVALANKGAVEAGGGLTVSDNVSNANGSLSAGTDLVIKGAVSYDSTVTDKAGNPTAGVTLAGANNVAVDSVNAGKGTVTAGTGSVTASKGGIAAAAVSAGQSVQAASGIAATEGAITAGESVAARNGGIRAADGVKAGTGITATSGDIVAGKLAADGITPVYTDVTTASGAISASGTAGTGNITAGNVSTDSGSITASGQIWADGAVTARSSAEGVAADVKAGNNIVAAKGVSADGSVSATNGVWAGDWNNPSEPVLADVKAGASITTSAGGITANNVTAGGDISTSATGIIQTTNAGTTKAAGNVEATTGSISAGGIAASQPTGKTVSVVIEGTPTPVAAEYVKGNVTAGKDINVANIDAGVVSAEQGTVTANAIAADSVKAQVLKTTASATVATDDGSVTLGNEYAPEAVRGELRLAEASEVAGTLSLHNTEGTVAELKVGGLEVRNGASLTAERLEVARSATSTPNLVRVGKDDELNADGSVANTGDKLGGSTLVVNSLDLGGNLLVVDPAWGKESSRVAVGEVEDALNLAVAQNSMATFGTTSTGWLDSHVRAVTNGKMLSSVRGGVKAAIGIAAPQKVGTMLVDGRSNGTTLAALATGAGLGTLGFTADSLLVVSATAADVADTAATGALFADTPKTATLHDGAKLRIAGAQVGHTYRVLGNNITPAYVKAATDGTGAPLPATPATTTAWTNANGADNLSTDTPLVTLDWVWEDANGDGVLEFTNLVTASLNPAERIIPGLDGGLAALANGMALQGIYDVDSPLGGVRFLSRAIDSAHNGGPVAKAEAKQAIESAATAIANAAPAATLSAVTAASSAVGERTSIANPAGTGMQVMLADGSVLSGAAAGENQLGLGLWIMPMYQKFKGDGLKSTGGSYDVDSDLGGVALGADYTFANNIRAGLTFNVGTGSSDSDGDFANTNNDFDFWGIGAYAGWSRNNIGITTDLSYSRTSNDLEQDQSFNLGGTLTGDVDAWAVSFGVRGEYKINVGGVDIVPHVGIRYTHMKTDGYSLRNAFGAVVDGDSMSQDLWTLPIGVAVSKDIALNDSWSLRPSLDLAVIPAFGDKEAEGSINFTGVAQSANVSSEVVDDVTGMAQLGIDLGNENLSFGLKYNFQAGESTSQHGVFGTLRYQF